MKRKIKYLPVLFLLSISTNFVNHSHLATQDHDQTESKIYNYQHKENQFDPQKKYQSNRSFRKRKNLARSYWTYSQTAPWSDYFLSDSNQKDKKLAIDLPFTNYYDIEQKITPTLQLQFKDFILYPSYYLCQQREICDIIKGDWTAVLNQANHGKNKKNRNINNNDKKICDSCLKDINYNMATLIVFYNFMTKFIEINSIHKILSKLVVANFTSGTKCPNNSVPAGLTRLTVYQENEIYIHKSELEAKRTDTKTHFFSGWNSSPEKNHTLLHELAHAAVNYLNITFNTDVYSLFKNFISQVFTTITSKDKIDINFYTAFQLSTSEYSLQSVAELIAEGFCFWLINDKYRTKTWDIWDDFFGTYLPKMLKTQPKRQHWQGQIY